MNPQSSHALLYLGATKTELGDYAGAILDLTKAAQIPPSIPIIHGYRAVARWKAGDQRGAAQDFQHSITNDPEPIVLLEQLAHERMEAEAFNEALILFN